MSTIYGSSNRWFSESTIFSTHVAMILHKSNNIYSPQWSIICKYSEKVKSCFVYNQRAAVERFKRKYLLYRYREERAYISKPFVRLSGRIFHQSQRKVLLKNIFFKDVVQVHDDDGWCSNVCLFTKRRPRTWKITTHRTHNKNDANILSDKYIVLQPFVDENEIFVWKVQSRLPYKKKKHLLYANKSCNRPFLLEFNVVCILNRVWKESHKNKLRVPHKQIHTHTQIHKTNG